MCYRFGTRQALAVELARSGAKVAISDVDTEDLAQTEERLKAIGTPVKTDRLDVTEREAFLAYADAVNEHFGRVHPGAIKTAIARNAGAAEGLDQAELANLFDKRLAMTTPQRAAQVILDGCARRRLGCWSAWTPRSYSVLVRLTGSRYQQLFGPVMGRLMPKQ